MKINSTIAFALITLFGSAGVAHADSFTNGKAYIGISSGAIMPVDLDFSADGQVADVTWSANGSVEFDEGYSVSGLFGWRWNDLLRTELEFGHSAVDTKKVTGSGTATYSGTSYTLSGSATIDADLDVFYGLANLLINPLSQFDYLSDSPVQPYIGAGVGFADITTTIDKIGTLTVGSSEDNTDLLVNAIAGLEYNVFDNLTADIRYRYFWVDSGKNGIDDGQAHSVNGSLRYSF